MQRQLSALFVLAAFAVHQGNAALCELLPPVQAEGPEFGLIFIPGEGSEGDAYKWVIDFIV